MDKRDELKQIAKREKEMSDRRYVLNRKCFAALKAIGPGAENRWKYVHIGPKGVTCTDTVSLIRVTLPNLERSGQSWAQAIDPVIYDLDTVKKLRPKGDENVTMPEGMEAKTTGKYTVPNFDIGIPDPKNQTATITVNAERLVSLLKAAIEVTEHSRSLVRLRFFKDSIRIDAHRDTGGQEFLGFIMGTTYQGDSIPGDAPKGTKPDSASETCSEKTLKLPVSAGRKFRD